MKQTSLDLDLSSRLTRKQMFLAKMRHVVPWVPFVQLIAPYYPRRRKRSSLFALKTMLRVHFMQQWFSLSDSALEEAYFDTPLTL